jgi:hypothetical protein
MYRLFCLNKVYLQNSNELFPKTGRTFAKTLLLYILCMDLKGLEHKFSKSLHVIINSKMNLKHSIDQDLLHATCRRNIGKSARNVRRSCCIERWRFRDSLFIVDDFHKATSVENYSVWIAEFFACFA